MKKARQWKNTEEVDIDALVAEERRKDPETFAKLDQMRTIGRQLVALRKASGLSQAEVAKRMKTSQPYVSRMEHVSDMGNYNYRAIQRYVAACKGRMHIAIQDAQGNDVSA